MGSWLWWILVGALSGWLAGYVLHRDTKFDVWDVIIGIVGGAVGGFLFYALGFVVYGVIAEIIAAFVGAVIVTVVWEKYLSRKV